MTCNRESLDRAYASHHEQTPPAAARQRDVFLAVSFFSHALYHSSPRIERRSVHQGIRRIQTAHIIVIVAFKARHCVSRFTRLLPAQSSVRAGTQERNIETHQQGLCVERKGGRGRERRD
jgi:hypothetical protein